jgi:hypothetical protein
MTESAMLRAARSESSGRCEAITPVPSGDGSARTRQEQDSFADRHSFMSCGITPEWTKKNQSIIIRYHTERDNQTVQGTFLVFY